MTEKQAPWWTVDVDENIEPVTPEPIDTVTKGSEHTDASAIIATGPTQLAETRETPDDPEKAALKAQLEELRGTVSRFSNLHEEIKALREQRVLEAKPEAISPPALEDDETLFDQDPLKYLRKNLRELREEIGSVKQTRERETREQRELREQSEKMVSFETEVKSELQEYRKTRPDYDQAVEYLLTNRQKELDYMGIPQDQWGQLMYEDSVRIATVARAYKKPVGEYVVELAKWSGWTGQAAKPAKQGISIEEKRAASGSVSGTGSNSKEFDIDMLNASADEFETFWKQYESEGKKADRKNQLR